MRRRMFIFVCGCVISMSFSTAHTAVPTSIAVQGKLTDSSGAPLPAGPNTLQFEIYDSEAGGLIVWPQDYGEFQSVPSNSEGFWSAMIGTIIPLTDDVFGDTARWLQITVYDDESGDATILPRIRLLTDPYAYRVSTVDGASGGAIRGSVRIIGGDLHLDLASASTGIIYKGGVPFLHDFGTDNTFLGREAGNLTMTGVGNTANGTSALMGNTEGLWNTANGAYALFGNTTGSGNTANGFFSLYSNTSGFSNTASGLYALQSNNTGGSNTACGASALYSNTTGDDNTAFGGGRSTGTRAEARTPPSDRVPLRLTALATTTRLAGPGPFRAIPLASTTRLAVP